MVEGTALAHPLLPAARVVPNDVALGADVRVLVVSGSNMSGKSTLLRTVGVNVVLALAGAPVRARRLVLSPVALGATLRIQDSLQTGKSRFFAEITRLKQIVDLASGPIPVLFLLDELLAGTNSHDRRLGAAGIVQGLVDKGAIGLVTTHDLALAEVVSDLGVHATQRALQRHVRGRADAFRLPHAGRRRADQQRAGPDAIDRAGGQITETQRHEDARSLWRSDPKKALCVSVSSCLCD